LYQQLATPPSQFNWIKLGLDEMVNLVDLNNKISIIY